MTVIAFIDWDSVLNNYDLFLALPNDERLSGKFRAQEKTAPLSPICVGFLNKFCLEHPEVRVVCTSTWRPDGKKAILNSLKKAHERFTAATGLKKLPFAIRLHDGSKNSWRTRIGMEYDRPRGKAIDCWLQDHGEPDQKYFILDDDDDFYEWQKPFLIRTDDHLGITLRIHMAMESMIKAPSIKPNPQLRLDFG